MKNISLTFSERLGLANFLGLAEGPLVKICALQRIFLQAQLSEEELSQVKQTPLPGDMIRYDPPSAEFGVKSIQVEDGDAEFLKAEIEHRQKLRLSDVAWVKVVKEQLAAASTKRRR